MPSSTAPKAYLDLNKIKEISLVIASKAALAGIVLKETEKEKTLLDIKKEISKYLLALKTELYRPQFLQPYENKIKRHFEELLLLFDRLFEEDSDNAVNSSVGMIWESLDHLQSFPMDNASFLVSFIEESVLTLLQDAKMEVKEMKEPEDSSDSSIKDAISLITFLSLLVKRLQYSIKKGDLTLQPLDDVRLLSLYNLTSTLSECVDDYVFDLDNEDMHARNQARQLVVKKCNLIADFLKNEEEDSTMDLVHEKLASLTVLTL